MELPKATLELLRDEAYALLCREAMQDRLASLVQEKEAIVHSRPPFGLLARKRTREAFENSLRNANETDAALRDRLARLARFEVWLHHCIRDELAKFLSEASPDYQQLIRLQQLLDEWEYHVRQQFPDRLTGLARDLRTVRLSATAVEPGPTACAHELAVLREAAVQVETLEERLAEIARLVSEFSRQVAANEMRVPPLPHFRRVGWVDWLCLIPLEQVVTEVTRVETEVRAFLSTGLQPALTRLQGSRVACAQLQENFLNHYWNQLREHAQAHLVEERDVFEVMDTIVQRYDREIARRQQNVTHNPFLSER